MIIVLRPNATEDQIQEILKHAREWGVNPDVSRGVERTIIGLIGPEEILRTKPLEAFPGVEKVVPVLKPYKRASLDYKAEPTRVVVGRGENSVSIGDRTIVVVAGPCSVETEEETIEIARAVKLAGARILRGGAFKPRTSPYSFQGLGERGLEILALARQETGLPVCTEVMDTKDVELVAKYTDILQIGARNMQNFSLLREVGRTGMPVLLKRGLSATIKEWLMSAEYILSEGNPNVILCERGIRTFETYTRNTLDLSAVPALRRETHLPIMVDPSHGGGIWSLVGPLARAAVAVGADGLMIEVHPHPMEAMSDGEQSLLPSTFERVMTECRKIARVLGREM
ncbi:MAG: 3-deoxy-7-phosphoheptulonate synthase [Verrucomicrobiota bacterium]|jgi:3-deoxy-7-phosphoheptulonate synthase|nr:3-deoxy-7-phosphoheptulonate synthase [Verrucomicrobiota bacterium]MDD8046464.1 3-deoxy-7-phosphoheptulonate synthase [Verrucomicrobiota bacterium]MDD8051579.1 3-deoxy-7-phosphoheptulonate synthase [Verrucomicrobiota bacterium]MDI9383054.1 3-deoxy-7-phosphoheptulonate synthase [Verrucomicrobiota bacterium]